MKNKFILFCFALGILAILISLTSAEIQVRGFNSVIKDSNNNQTRHTLYITLDDTSLNDIAKQTLTNVTIFATHNLNFTFPNNVTLITCSYNSIQIKNDYDSNGNLNTSTTETIMYDYNYSATSLIYYQLKEKDILQINLDCFYDTNVDNSIFFYQSEAVIGLVASTPSFACDECTRGGFEQAVTDYLDAQKSTQNQIGFYATTSSLTDKTTEFWIAVYWLLRFSAYILLLYLAFAIGLRFYKFIQELKKG